MLDKIQRANLTAGLVLDDTPRAQWRVSSPLSSPLQRVHNSLARLFIDETRKLFPVVVLRSDDWRGHQKLFKNNTKIYISWNSIRSHLNLTSSFNVSSLSVVRCWLRSSGALMRTF